MSFPVQFHRGPSGRKLKTPPHVSVVEKLLLPLFGGQIHATRKVIERLRVRIPTDEDIISHVEVLRKTGWPDWAIKETLILKPYPPVTDILRLQCVLETLGLSDALAIAIIARVKCMAEVHNIPEFERKSKIAMDGRTFNISQHRRILMQQAALIASHSEEELQTAVNQLKLRNVKASVWMYELQRALRKKPTRKTSS